MDSIINSYCYESTFNKLYVYMYTEIHGAVGVAGLGCAGLFDTDSDYLLCERTTLVSMIAVLKGDGCAEKGFFWRVYYIFNGYFSDVYGNGLYPSFSISIVMALAWHWCCHFCCLLHHTTNACNTRFIFYVL